MDIHIKKDPELEKMFFSDLDLDFYFCFFAIHIISKVDIFPDPESTKQKSSYGGYIFFQNTKIVTDIKSSYFLTELLGLKLTYINKCLLTFTNINKSILRHIRFYLNGMSILP